MLDPFAFELALAAFSTLKDILGRSSKNSFNLLTAVNAEVKVPTQSRESLLRDINTAYEAQKLVLVLGAGVSAPYRVPTWETLLQGLLLASFQHGSTQSSEQASIAAQLFSEIMKPSPLIAARYLKYQGVLAPDGVFEERVRQLLYATLRTDFDSDLMKEIRQICVAPGKSPTLDSVITYNFDDILETCLNNLEIDIPFTSVHSTAMKVHAGTLPIYHVHGFLPREGTIATDSKLTFSKDVYHAAYTDLYNWSNLVQLNKFRENSCLFLGVSLTDPNLRRLLDAAQKHRGSQDLQHFIVRRRHPILEISAMMEDLVEKNQQLAKEIEKKQLEVKALLSLLIDLMHKFEENDARSFGIGTLWVDEFDDIPEILHDIRSRELR